MREVNPKWLFIFGVDIWWYSWCFVLLLSFLIQVFLLTGRTNKCFNRNVKIETKKKSLSRCVYFHWVNCSNYPNEQMFSLSSIQFASNMIFFCVYWISQLLYIRHFEMDFNQIRINAEIEFISNTHWKQLLFDVWNRKLLFTCKTEMGE